MSAAVPVRNVLKNSILIWNNMKLERTTYFQGPQIAGFGNSAAYHFKYPVLKPRDIYEDLYPYRHWNIMAHTISIMDVAPGLNTRRKHIKVKATLFKQLCERVKQWLNIPVLRVFNLR